MASLTKTKTAISSGHNENNSSQRICSTPSLPMSLNLPVISILTKSNRAHGGLGPEQTLCAVTLSQCEDGSQIRSDLEYRDCSSLDHEREICLSNEEY